MKIAFIFPGQGSQKVGMLNNYLDHAITTNLMHEANDALGFDLQKLIMEGPAEKLNLTEYAQPAILATSFIAYSIFRERNLTIQASYVSGHSLGEYTAYLVGGSFNFPTALKLVHNRGKFMQQATKEGVGAMAAIIGADANQVNELCQKLKQNDVLQIANYNCPGQIVVSGHTAAVERILKEIKSIKLPVSAPFHSSLMQPAADNMKKLLDLTTIIDSSLPVVTNDKNEYITAANEIKPSLTNQIVAAVKWQTGIESMIKNGVEYFIEFGPSKVLANMLKRIDDKIPCQVYSDYKEQITITN